MTYKKTKNKSRDPKKFQKIKNLLMKDFPFKNFRIGGHMAGKTLYDIGYVKDPNFKAISATVEIVGSN